MRVEDGPMQVSVLVEDINHHFVDRDVSSDGLGVFQLALHFDPQVVTVSSVEPGPFLASTGRTTSCFSQIRPDDDSTFDFGCVSESPPDNGPQGSGTLARLTLQPVGGGSSDLTLDGELGGPSGSNGDDIPIKVTDGSLTVIGPPAPTPLPGQRRTPTPRPGTQGDGNAGSSTGTPGASNGGTVASTTPGADGSVDGISVAGGGSGQPQSSPTLLMFSAGLALLGAWFLFLAGATMRRSRRLLGGPSSGSAAPVTSGEREERMYRDD